MDPNIKYVGLDFDGCICDIGTSLWTLFCLLDTFETRLPTQDVEEIRRKWEKVLARETLEGHCHLLRPAMISFLRRIRLDIPFLDQPFIFVYTNNQSEAMVTFVHHIIQELLGGKVAWGAVYHPQDPCRQDEAGTHPSALSSKLKSFAGIYQCLDKPDDLTKESLLYLDDQEHPLILDLGPKYIRVPEYHNSDTLLFYLRSLILAAWTTLHEPAKRSVFFQFLNEYLSLGLPNPLTSDEEIRQFLQDIERGEAAAIAAGAITVPSPFLDTMTEQLESFFT